MNNWIKLNNWKKVQFPDVCSFSGLPAKEVKTFMIYNTSFLWRVLGVLQWGQYIELDVPFSQEALTEMKKQKRKVFVKGLLIGLVFALIGFVLGVYINVVAEAKFVNNLGIIIGGCSFVGSLILGPVIGLYKLHLSSSPLYFRKKNKELWVRIRNDNYKKQFVALNDFMIIPEASLQDSEILDKDM
jgi:hypothetical protein